jgi:hypothetical protein
MEGPIIFAADDGDARTAGAVLRLLQGAGDAAAAQARPARTMVRPAPVGAPRRGRQAVPRPPVRSRRQGR